MRVLVTGHNGYIGSVLAPFIAAAGHDVVGLDTFLFEDCTFGQDTEAIEAMRLDVRDVRATDLEGFDAVIHLAALSNDPLGNLNSQCTYDINHLAAVHLARLAKEAGVQRFLFASSCSLYGAGRRRDARRGRGVQSDHRRTASRRCWSSATSRGSPTTRFSPDVPAQRHRLRALAAPARATSS